MVISNARAKHKRAPAGVASGSTTSNNSNDSADAEAITVGPVASKPLLPGKTRNAKNTPVAKGSTWEMTAEEALRVNFVEFEI